MTSSTVLEEVKDLKEKLRLETEGIAALERKAWELWQEENLNATTFERFQAWLEFGPKNTNYSYIERIRAGSGKEFWDSLFPYAERHQVYYASDIFDVLFEHWQLLDKSDFTKEELDDWAEQFIAREFKSMFYDW